MDSVTKSVTNSVALGFGADRPRERRAPSPASSVRNAELGVDWAEAESGIGAN